MVSALNTHRNSYDAKLRNSLHLHLHSDTVRWFLANWKLFDVKGDRVTHLLHELLHVRPGGVRVAGGLVLPGLDDHVVFTTSDFLAKIAGNTAGTFLKKEKDEIDWDWTKLANCCDVMSRPLQESWPSLMRFVYPAATIKELNGHSPEWSEATIRPLELENNKVEALNWGERERKVIINPTFLTMWQ